MGNMNDYELQTGEKRNDGPTVVILTYCQSPALLYGTLLIFRSIRVGFPSARVMVFDNGSSADTRPQIAQAAQDSGCEFYPMGGMHYTAFYRWLLLEQEAIDSAVLVDPDVVFWDRVEDWNFGDALMAGRLIPPMSNHGCTQVKRLHTSHLWFPDIRHLRSVCKNLMARAYGFDPIRQISNTVDGRFFFWDTLASLYNAIPGQCRAFGEHELDHYDHLFFGSHLPIIKPGVDSESILRGHELAAAGDFSGLRGIWRDQERYFQSKLPYDPNSPFGLQAAPEQVRASMLDTLRELRDTQGVQSSEADMESSIASLCRNLLE